MQLIQKRKQLNMTQQTKMNNSYFSKIKNRIMHTYQHQKQIIQQIDQKVTKKQQKVSSQTKILMQTLKLTHKRTESKDFTKKLKLKDYIRLNEISRQKRSQSASLNKLRCKNSLSQNKKIDQKQLNSDLQQTKVHKKPLKPYEKEIELEKGQLLLTIQKTREKFEKIMKLIEDTNNKFSGYNDLVFMFNVQELVSNYLLKGLEEIQASYTEHFAEMDENNAEISYSKSKQTANMSPAVRAQLKTIQQMFLMGICKKKENLLVSFDRSVTQFDDKQSNPDLNSSNPKIRIRHAL